MILILFCLSFSPSMSEHYAQISHRIVQSLKEVCKIRDQGLNSNILTLNPLRHLINKRTSAAH